MNSSKVTFEFPPEHPNLIIFHFYDNWQSRDFLEAAEEAVKNAGDISMYHVLLNYIPVKGAIPVGVVGRLKRVYDYFGFAKVSKIVVASRNRASKTLIEIFKVLTNPLGVEFFYFSTYEDALNFLTKP